MRAIVLHVLVVSYAIVGMLESGLAFASLPGAATVPLAFLAGGLFVASAVVFGIWLADAYAWVGEGKHSKGWTVGSWYIPFGTMATPHAPTLDLWRRSTGNAPDGRVWTWLLAWSAWWALAAVGFIAGLALGVDAAVGAFQSGGERAVEPDIPAWLLFLGVAQGLAVFVAAVGLVLSTRAIEATRIPAGMAPVS